MKKIAQLIFAAFAAALFFSCQDEKFTHSADAVLSFSADTVHFDTVFSGVGSTTQKLMVYNRNGEGVRVSSVRLAGGDRSPFRVNVDGVAGTSFGGIEILRKDSMFVFVEVTVDPTDENLPFLVRDSLLFVTNTVEQKVILEAFGQNAVVMRNAETAADVTLSADKPYLVYGTWTVGAGATLTVPEGCRIYFHQNAGIDVLGTLAVEGTAENPVTMRGDRLDCFLKDYRYDELPGQWNGIRLGEGASAKVRHADMRGGHTAFGAARDAELQLESVRIENFDGCGVDATLARVTVANSLLADCRRSCLRQTGGTLLVEQSTIADFYTNLASSETRLAAAVVLTNRDGETPCPLDGATFVNSIVWGSGKNEISFERIEDESVAFNYSFASSLVRQTEADAHFTDVLLNENPGFVSEKYPHDYHLTENSAARDAAFSDLQVARKYPLDLDGNLRSADGKPDFGAFEFIISVNE